MLEQNMVEAQKGVVDIIDVDPDTLWQMLEFVYTGQVARTTGFRTLWKNFCQAETPRIISLQ